MRYLVKARVKSGCAGALAKAIADGTLGRGSIAGDEYLYDMEMARVNAKGEAHWVELVFVILHWKKSVPIGRNILICCR